MLVIKERVEDRLLEQPGVTGVGLTRKRVQGQFTDTLAIIVYVEKKRPLDEVPPAERIPAEIDGIPTDVIESPIIVIRQGTPDESRYEVLKAGIRIAGSVGGTLGFIGRTTEGYKRGPGLHVLVSNQHVVRGFTQDVAPGSAHSVGQPDGQRCCESCDFCGRIVGHDRVNSILNEDVDGGVVELNAGVQWMPHVQDLPNSVPIADIRAFAAAEAPMPVWKRGATTQRTTASATDPNFSGKATFPDGGGFHRNFKRSIRIEGNNFSDGGDSGAPVMDNANKMIGMLFGGGGHTHTACHIHQVQSFLHVQVATVANTPAGTQTVPSMEPSRNDRNTHGPPLPQVASAGPGIPILMRSPSSLYNDVAQTDFGRTFLRNLILHRDEIARLAKRRRVIVAWRRYGGAHVTTRTSHGVPEDEMLVPSTFGGRPAAECADALVRTLKRYCSPDLSHDIDRYLPYVPLLAGTTVREFLATLGQLEELREELPVER